MRVSQICRRSAAANFGRKTFTGNRTDTNWSSTKFIGKISVFIVVFKFVMHFVISGQSDYIRKISLNFSQITQEDINLLLTKTTAARSSQEAEMTSQCS